MNAEALCEAPLYCIEFTYTYVVSIHNQIMNLSCLRLNNLGDDEIILYCLDQMFLPSNILTTIYLKV